ncbi:MAG: hypothetical protein EBE86_025865 [Hormoscilla sp. GUM202]|nr:hypothetical protein [Hormoscilla sp. GUM202]
MGKGTGNREQGTGGREQGNREQGETKSEKLSGKGFERYIFFFIGFKGTGNREQGTGNRGKGTGNREQGTGGREQGNREQGETKSEKLSG